MKDHNKVHMIRETIKNKLKIRADDIEKIFQVHSNVVITDPCGAGKTVGSLEFISRHWRDGVLFASGRTDGIQNAQRILVELGVPEDEIGVYVTGTDDTKYLNENVDAIPKRVSLVTHSRLENENISRWVYFADWKSSGGRLTRKYAFIDEPANVAQNYTISLIGAQYLIDEVLDQRVRLMKTNAVQDIDPERLDDTDINLNLEFIAKTHRSPIKPFGFDDLNAMYIGDTEVHIKRRVSLFRRLVSAMIDNRYKINGNNVEITVHTNTEISLSQLCEYLAVLDATGDITRYIHLNLPTVRYSDWLGHIKTLYILDTYYTKSNASNEDLVNTVRYLMTVIDKPTVIVTWMQVEDEIRAIIPQEWEVFHYGATRGSNDYQDFESVVVLGSFYKNKEYYQKFEKLGQRVDMQDDATAESLQDIWRSAARVNQKIDLWLALDPKLTKRVIEHISNLIPVDSKKMIDSAEFNAIDRGVDKIIDVVLNELRNNNNEMPTKDLVTVLKDRGFGGTIRKPYDLKLFITRKYSTYPITFEDRIIKLN